MYSYIAKSVFDEHLGSSNDPCYIQNCVIMNRVIKRLRCTCIPYTCIYEILNIKHVAITDSGTG